MSRTIFYGPRDVRAIEVRLYLGSDIPRTTSYSVSISKEPQRLIRVLVTQIKDQTLIRLRECTSWYEYLSAHMSEGMLSDVEAENLIVTRIIIKLRNNF